MRAASACKACADRQARPHCGAYNMRCVVCCAALIISARPNRDAQEAFFACITRRRENPNQAAIIAAIRQADAPADATAPLPPQPRPAPSSCEGLLFD